MTSRQNGNRHAGYFAGIEVVVVIGGFINIGCMRRDHAERMPHFVHRNSDRIAEIFGWLRAESISRVGGFKYVGRVEDAFVRGKVLPGRFVQIAEQQLRHIEFRIVVGRTIEPPIGAIRVEANHRIVDPAIVIFIQNIKSRGTDRRLHAVYDRRQVAIPKP